jgi:hemolysin activation/secretion protein
MRAYLPLLFLAAVLPCVAWAADATETVDVPLPKRHLGPELFAARPGEAVLAKRLRGLRFITGPDQLTAPGFPQDILDLSLIPEMNTPGFIEVLVHFHNKPVSRESLERLVRSVRSYMGLMRSPFVSVYLPPQDITDGYVQVVVSEATVDGPVNVLGAHYFSASNYRAAVSQQPGQPVDRAQLDEDVAWLNRNPYRQAQLSAAAGSKAGTTRLDLMVQERFPVGLSAGFDNTGTKSTGQDRVSAGVVWANALWRGDQMSYRFIGDPALEHSKTHSLSYMAFLPWRHIATFTASYSSINSIMAPPFEQHGTSWQLGTHYEIPLRAPREGWTQNLSFSADLKYSDNNLLFASIPITNNPTRIPELGAAYGVSFRALGGQNSATFSGYVSPGGLGDQDGDRAFNGSRFGAKARFAYGTFNFAHDHPLRYGFTWDFNLNAQAATGALLGTEQLNGGGSSAVRGYSESSAFGDGGVVVSNELHAPPFVLPRLQTSFDVFGFVDFASLNLRVDNESTDLRSVGLGANLQVRRNLSVRFAYGWQLKKLDFHRNESGHGHIAANLSF